MIKRFSQLVPSLLSELSTESVDNMALAQNIKVVECSIDINLRSFYT